MKLGPYNAAFLYARFPQEYHNEILRLCVGNTNRIKIKSRFTEFVLEIYAVGDKKLLRLKTHILQRENE